MGRQCSLILGLWLASVTVGSAQGASTSDDEVARNLFQAGKVAYDAGDFEGAFEFFEKSYARSHRPELLYNIGQTADRLRNDQKTLDSFRAYLAALPNADNRAEVENRIRALERTRSVAPAPTPAETAAAAMPSASSTPVTAATTDDTPLTGQWWFWTVIGAVVVGGVVTAIALSSGDEQAGPLNGNTGVTVMTLGAEP